MISGFVRGSILTGALAFAGIAASVGSADARTRYDGNWSVLIITQSGACERAYRYGVEISDGSVFYDGSGPVNLQGRVARNGAVQVTVSAGDQRAHGFGRLSGDRGGGSWRGQGSTGACAGRWVAERRDY